MKDHLLDIIKHTHKLGMFDLVKITGTEEGTSLDAITEDRGVILQAKVKGPIGDFVGTFGMPNLNKLNTILNIPEYKEDAVITVVNADKNGKKVPVGITFENKVGDFKNEYRFMGAEIVNDRLPVFKFKGVRWNVDILPSVESIQRLRYQSAANSEIDKFIAKTENGNLKFFFGDASSHAGSFTFETHVAGNLSRAWSWPVDSILSILTLPGNKTLKFSDEGAAMITVDSGLIDYNYIIPALTT